MSFGTGVDGNIEQIRSIAETKGIEIDDIEHKTTTDDGGTVHTYNIYETHADTEENSVGIQATYVPNAPEPQMMFRNQVQKKMGSLKEYMAGDTTGTDEPVAADDSDDLSQPEPAEPAETTQSPSLKPDEVTPGQTLDQRLGELEARIEALEATVEEHDETVGALGNLLDS
jgi:hypothetical protein